ncbi:T6SS effector BTH_I2691 family protein [Chromobacterium haemolyticum]|uniref:T6SS effector BTH_I2691 family protein n=1 Tax=Chromobacterium haemolyticum TaxID=394935 RepID=UPI000D303987|nr:T6SS effector BTH_I2691 family protein [Chromobacterium haemolyticum]PTU70300.1 hypothetical protein DBB33_13005 [Chromobacterium haemolyticum]
MSQLCKACQASGLPIMPVRYAPVPKTVKAALPAWACADKVKDIALDADFHYAMRTLRAGFVYLFYSKHARGFNLWECYSVTEDGVLLKQPSPKAAKAAGESVVCSTSGHSNSRLHHLIIEQPEKCGPAWIAFSEYKWSDLTLRRYAQDAKLRAARMQAIDPKAMAAGSSNAHGTTASKAAIEAVMEYHPGYQPAQLAYNPKTEAFSKEDGSYDKARVDKNYARYPIHARRGKAEESLQFMQARAKKSGGNNTPHILALWDAIGTAQELNGYVNDSAGLALLFAEERGFQLHTIQALENIRKSLSAQAQERQEKFQDDMMRRDTATWYNPAVMAQRRAAIAKLQDPVLKRQRLEVCDLLDQWAGWQIPAVIAPNELDAIDVRRIPEPQRSQQIAALKAKVAAFRSKRGENYDNNIEQAGDRSWPKYRKKIDPDRLSNFQKFQNELDAAIRERQNKTVGVLLRWLQAPLFLDTLEDYHDADPKDGIEFEAVIGHAISGINVTASGQAKLEAWAKDVAIARNNVLYRALALNQKKIETELKAALKDAKQNQDTPYSDAAVRTIETTKNYFQKLLDMYKENSALYQANIAAASPQGDTVFGVSLKTARTGQIDHVIVTAGNAIVKAFAPAAGRAGAALKLDKAEIYLGEKLLQMVLASRALVSTADIKALVAAEYADFRQRADLNRKKEPSQRTRNKRLQKVLRKEAEYRRTQGAKLQQAYNKLRADKPKDHLSVVKDARLTLLVMMIEGVYLGRLLLQNEKDGALYASLAASAMALTAQAIDMMSLPLSKVMQGGEQARSIQRLKLMGGLLMAASNGIGAYQDYIAIDTAKSKGQSLVVNLYRVKAIAGLAGLTVAGLSTFTYAAPLIMRVSSNVVIADTAAAIGARATAILATRIIFMTAGSWISLTIFILQGIILAVEDDDLQIWISQTPFGVDHKNSKAPSNINDLTNSLKKIMEKSTSAEKE